MLLRHRGTDRATAAVCRRLRDGDPLGSPAYRAVGRDTSDVGVFSIPAHGKLPRTAWRRWSRDFRAARAPRDRRPVPLHPVIYYPMYMGHLIFMLGLAITFRSLLALALFVFHVFWFNQRAAEDEAYLGALFGADYAAY